MTRRHLLGLVVAVTVTLTAGPAPAEVDRREMQGREAFAAGRYQEALDIFVKLYAEKLHPNYLRNIGRCYQNLEDPDKAISSFHEYLRKAKTVSASERAEVEGYIGEMEALKRRREAAAAATPAPTITPRPTATASSETAAGAPGKTAALSSPPAPTSPPRAVNSDVANAPGTMLTESHGPTPAPEEAHPVYTRWWFWTLIGGAVVGGVATAAALGAFTKTENAPCGAGCLN